MGDRRWTIDPVSHSCITPPVPCPRPSCPRAPPPSPASPVPPSTIPSPVGVGDAYQYYHLAPALNTYPSTRIGQTQQKKSGSPARTGIDSSVDRASHWQWQTAVSPLGGEGGGPGRLGARASFAVELRIFQVPSCGTPGRSLPHDAPRPVG